MLGILRKFFAKNRGYKLVWIVVISSVLFNLGATRYELTTNLNLIDHPFYGIFLSPLSDVRYGHFIARKLFLVVIAFVIFSYWLTTQKSLFPLVKVNLKYIVFIGFFLVLSRILTFDFWFYNDDIRFFQYHLFAPTQSEYNPQGSWGPIGLHPIAIFLLVIRWFEINYTLYNVLGLLFYFLGSIGIFTLINKLQKSKFISLAAAIFFLTTPTYFQGRLLISEVINSPFTLLLLLLSILMLLYKFIPGALIFAAAALEYGVAKTYFIALPLSLFAIFFAGHSKNLFLSFMKDRKLIFFVAAVCLISLVYTSAFFRAPSSSGKTLGLDELFVFGDVLMAVTLPYGISYPLVHLLSLILNGWIYITAVLGFLVVAGIAVVGVIFYLKKQTLAAKLIFIGLSTILLTAAIGSYMGIRVDHNVLKLVQYHIGSEIPSGATGYGFFPALGLTLILAGMCYAINKKRAFRVFVVFFILFNTIMSISSDYKWRKSPYSLVQRRYDDQLQKILPRDGVDKYIYIASSQRLFFEGVRTFGSVHLGDHGFFTFSSSKDFAQALMNNKIQNMNIYFLVTDGESKYNVYDHSNKIRGISYDQLIPVLETLSEELTANPKGL